MYLLEINTLTKQLLPPHWRGGIKEIMLKVLISPVFSIYDRLMELRKTATQDSNISSQVLVLDAMVKRISGSNLSYIVDGNDFSFDIWLPATIDNAKTNEIKKTIDTYKIAGVRYNIKQINN